MRERQAELDRLGVNVLAVTFEPSSKARAYRERERLPVPVLSDPDRVAYRAFGLARRPLTTIWGPRTLWYYLRGLLLRGQPRRRRAGADPYQLGGDVILRPDRRGGWIYPSRSPVDRPSVGSVLRIARRTQQKARQLLH